MARQKPPNPRGRITGFPYDDLWEEFAPPERRLYDHGVDRDRINRAFAKARKLGATFKLTRARVRATLEPLELRPTAKLRLAEKLYYFAGHYYSPKFHKLFGDDPASCRRKLKSVAPTAARLERQMSKLTPSIWRQVGAARWSLGQKRRGSPHLDWAKLQDFIADIATSAQRVADEFPQFRRGSTENVLLGRWLRQSAEAIELATGNRIVAKSSDAAGRFYRFENLEGSVFKAYCQLVDPRVTVKAMVRAAQAYHRYGFAGRPPKSPKPAI